MYAMLILFPLYYFLYLYAFVLIFLLCPLAEMYFVGKGSPY